MCDGGAVRIVDFLPMGERCNVVRIVEGLEGEVPVEMLLDLRFGYGSDKPLVTLSVTPPGSPPDLTRRNSPARSSSVAPAQRCRPTCR
jgi:hypothetical protein